MQATIIIPAYQPDEKLLQLLDQLVRQGQERIIVVNDGSHPDCDHIFTRAGKYDGVEIIHHRSNRGKGAALRSGFRFVLGKLSSCRSVITADADGQHRAEDIAKVQAVCMDKPEHLVLGVRQFTGYVPLRSRLGNALTRRLYNLLFKQRLSDTQTGLRGIPVDKLDMIISLKSQRYSFELEMLLSFNKIGTPVMEVPISTVYEEKNSSSHFRPLLDSIRIYATLITFWLTNR